MKKVFILILFITTTNAFAQQENWLVSIMDGKKVCSRAVFECYDRGFCFMGWHIESNPHFSFLTKTDINGNQLWTKAIGAYGYNNTLLDAEPTSDGGVVLVGNTSVYDGYFMVDPVILKLNACGEKEWCRIFRTVEHRDNGIEIIATQDGGCTATFSYTDPYVESNEMELVHLDADGQLVWRNSMESPYIGLTDEYLDDLIETPDNGALLTGRTYYDEVSKSKGTLHGYMIKTDSDGNVNWESVPLSEIDEEFGQTYNSVIDTNSRTIYSSGRHGFFNPSPGGYKPAFYKHDLDGNLLDVIDVDDSLYYNGTTKFISMLSDTTIIGGLVMLDIFDTIKFSIAKYDTLGTILDSITFIQEDATVLTRTVQDDKFIVVLGDEPLGVNYDIFFYRLTNDLEYDSLYTAPFEYDYLCEGTIVEDTINFTDCDISIDISEHKVKTPELHIYPNPTDEQITIALPEYLQTKKTFQIFGESTLENAEKTVKNIHSNYQWQKDARVEILNINGMLIHSERLQGQQKELHINVSNYPKGIYMVRIITKNKDQITKKFIVI